VINDLLIFRAKSWFDLVSYRGSGALVMKTVGYRMTPICPFQSAVEVMVWFSP